MLNKVFLILLLSIRVLQLEMSKQEYLNKALFLGNDVQEYLSGKVAMRALNSLLYTTVLNRALYTFANVLSQ